MADLSIRTRFVDGTTVVKLIDQECICICSSLSKLQIRTYLQNNRPGIWNAIKANTTELAITPCPSDPTKNHYTIMLDRP